MAAGAATQRGGRDLAVISLVGVAHYMSHVLQLALPPLIPVLHDELGASYTALGLFGTLFYATSGFGQAAAGFLVDRYGAHRLLVGGLALLSGAIAAAGLTSSYWMLLPLALVAGLGNCVFHPADLSILSHRVSEGRLGRAYAVHGISGSLGYATPPIIVPIVAHFANWHVALITLGAAGMVVAAIVFANRPLLLYQHTAPVRSTARRGSYLDVIGAPVVLMAFFYFALTSFAGTGMQTFSATALNSGYGFSLSAANLSLFLYLFSAGCGMMVGGFLAERTRQHHRVAVAGIAIAALVMTAIATIPNITPLVVPLMAFAGLANGITGPSRDVLVRRAAAGIGTGSVFGFVYSGFDLGSSTAPLLFGMLLDHDAPNAVFLAIACSFALGVPTVMQVRHRISARGQPIEAD